MASRERSRSLRRRWSASAACLALAALACAPTARAPRSAVAICLDTVRFDTFWLPERAGLRDEFHAWAERAQRFQRAYAPAPWTVPSVASFLTGVYPARHGAGSYRGSEDTLRTRLPSPLPAEFATLPELLHLRGYQTAAFVAQQFFHPAFGLSRGFDVLAFAPDAREIADRALAWLDRQRSPGAPFFLYLHLMEAHQAHMLGGPEAVRARADATPEPLREAARRSAPADTCAERDAEGCVGYQAYAGAILGQRRAVAELLAQLERRGLLRHALVVLYADHGEEFGDHLAQEQARGSDRRGIFGVGHGQSLYGELLHVPLLVWDPERGGRDVERVTSLVEVAPRVAEWLGERDLDAAWDSRLGEGEVAETAPQGPVFASEIAFGPEATAVIDGRWKRVRRSDPEERVLFDLAEDPEEQAPTDDPEVGRRLDALLDDYEAAARTPAAAPTGLSRDDIRALRQLGYLQDVE